MKSIKFHAESYMANWLIQQLDTSASEPISAITQSAVDSENTTAADLGLKDFYAIHVLTYCEGTYKDDGDHAMKVTSCSKRRAPFAFDPETVFSAELNDGFNISDIDWPDTITDDFEVMAMTTKAMSILYILGMAATGIAFLMEILLTQAGGKPVMFAHLFFTVVGSLTN
jgi:SUR7/PalI family